MSDSHMEVKVLGQLHVEGDEVISEGEAIPDTTDMRHSTNMMTEVCVQSFDFSLPILVFTSIEID